MPKFQAASAHDLRTKERNVGRVTRKAKFIVTVEADDGSWFELDAVDQGHAGAMARNQVDKMKSRGASCWRVERSGKLSRLAFYTYYWNGDDD